MQAAVHLCVHTSCRSLLATAMATLGVVTTSRKLKKTVQKKNSRLLRPTAAKGRVPSLPTIAAREEHFCLGKGFQSAQTNSVLKTTAKCIC